MRYLIYDTSTGQPLRWGHVVIPSDALQQTGPGEGMIEIGQDANPKSATVVDGVLVEDE